jgi:hypothetical protein
VNYGLKEYNIFDLVGKTKENLRKLMSRTVEAYPVEWITVHEAIQNARDAIQKCTLPQGEVDVSLNLDNQTVKVTDSTL